MKSEYWAGSPHCRSTRPWRDSRVPEIHSGRTTYRRLPAPWMAEMTGRQFRVKQCLRRACGPQEPHPCRVTVYQTEVTPSSPQDPMVDPTQCSPTLAST